MDNNFSEAIKSLRERLTNPFLSSFIIAWILANWKITIALLWFNSRQYELAGHKNIFSFIEKELNPCSSFIKPLIAAILYTLLIPILRMLISAFTVYINSRSSEWNMIILKDKSIPFEKYLKLKDDNSIQRRKLIALVEDEENKDKELKSKEGELEKVNSEISRLKLELEKTNSNLNEMTNYNIIAGHWKYSRPLKVGNSKQINDILKIENGKIFIKMPNNSYQNIYNIRNFYYDKTKQIISFVKEKELSQNDVNDPREDFLSNTLQFSGETNSILTGSENGLTVQYQKI